MVNYVLYWLLMLGLEFLKKGIDTLDGEMRITVHLCRKAKTILIMYN